MQVDCFPQPRRSMYVALLKECTKLKNLDKGLAIHAQVAAVGLLRKDVFVGSALVDMYAKCGVLAKSQQVFDELANHNVVVWTALIAGYVEHGQGDAALRAFYTMQNSCVTPNDVTFICILKACAITGAINKGREIHAHIERLGLGDKDLAVGNSLVNMYAKCGSLAIAQEVMDTRPSQNIISWTSIIAGSVEHGQGEKALKCYKRMQLEGVSPNAMTFASILKVCSSMELLEKGIEVHVEVERQGLLRDDLVIGNALVDMYAKHGLVTKSQEVFDRILAPNVVSWTSLISGYAEHGYGEKALTYFHDMKERGVTPNSITFISVLKACGSISDLDKGKEIHIDIERRGLSERDLIIPNTLVDMYVKCGLVSRAQQVFDRTPYRDAISWNALITGYAEHRHGEDALKCLEQMQVEGFLPDAITCVSSFKACGAIGCMCKGRGIHAKIEEHGILEEDDLVGSTLVDMYFKLGSLAMARQVFERLPAKVALSWTTLIAGYVEHGHGEDALKCFEQMQHNGVPPLAATLVSTLKACSIVGCVVKGQDIHCEVERQGVLGGDPVVGSSLVDMYAKCGSMAMAHQLFDSLIVQDVVSWTALIAGYAAHEQGEEALNCFDKMQLQGIAPNAITLLSSLKACACVGATDKGLEIHAAIERQGLMVDNTVIGNALLSMYAKCGSLSMAQGVFEELPSRDVVSWTALMAGYAQGAQSEGVFDVFNEMLKQGVEPSPVSFVVVLNACNRMGLYDSSQTYYQAMSTYFGIAPTNFHHNCVVDLLGRVGELDKVAAILKELPLSHNLVAYRSVLGACKSWGNVILGKQAFESALHLDDTDSAPYVLMSQVYAGSESAAEVKKKAEDSVTAKEAPQIGTKSSP